MKRILSLLVVCFIASIKISSAQIVGQGAAGTDPWPVTSTPAPDQVATGTITSATCPGTGCVSLALSGAASGQMDVAVGDYTGGSLTFEATADGTTWRRLDATYYNFSMTSREVKNACCSGITGEPLFQFNAAGLSGVRVRATGYTSGTATVTIRVTSGSAATNVVASQGAPNPSLLPWWVAFSSPPAVTVSSGTITFTNTSIQIGGSLPAGAATIGAVNLAQYTPVAGRLPVDGSGVIQPISAAALPLPAGAATEASLLNVLTSTVFQARINTLGQKAMAASTPVVLPNDQVVPVSATQLQGVVIDSTTTPLGISGTYNSAWISVLDYGRIAVTVFADQNGAPVTSLKLQWSNDAVNTEMYEAYPVAASISSTAMITPRAAWLKVTYFNSTVAQGVFRLYTIAGRAEPTYSDGFSTRVIGDVVNGNPDSGVYGSSAPIKIGCRAQSGFAAVSNGQRVDVRCDTFGRVSVIAVMSYSPMTTNAPATASVGVASAQIVASNASRRGLIIGNMSNAKICLAVGATAVIDSGICLQPDAVFNMNEFSNFTGAINAIAGAAASVVSIQEMQ